MSGLNPFAITFWQFALGGPFLLTLWGLNVNNERAPVAAYWHDRCEPQPDFAPCSLDQTLSPILARPSLLPVTTGHPHPHPSPQASPQPPSQRSTPTPTLTPTLTRPSPLRATT
eukprot:5320060-Prymnesium_polylepis.1